MVCVTGPSGTHPRSATSDSTVIDQKYERQRPMLGMRLGGIDPSVLRELSGVYKPFVKAFKELISNGFDADADFVSVEFTDDFTCVTVNDDGSGMNPFDFRSDFTRIGGGGRRLDGDRTRRGRLRIGNKGIGFLALARYCDRLIVESTSDRPHEHAVLLSKTPCSLQVLSELEVPIGPDLLGPRVVIEAAGQGGRRNKLTEGKHFRWDPKKCRVIFDQDFGPVTVKLTVDCRALAFRACLDFERLLKLADNADLEKLDDFASIEVYEHPAKASLGTRITAEQLKNFVRRELRADRRKGFVRNVASRAGLEQFTWPFLDVHPSATPCRPRIKTSSSPTPCP
jgi:hypothetical protein